MKPASATKEELKSVIMTQEAQLSQFEASRAHMEMSWAQSRTSTKPRNTTRPNDGKGT